MSTQQQIDDPGQWRVGDEATYEYTDGYPITGKLWLDPGDQSLYLGPQIIRNANGHVLVTRITVTRTVEPIPEPTVPWALVRFEKGPVLRLGAATRRWVDVDGESYTWAGAQRIYGAPVAVSLPHWSDEVDGLRARVEKLADEWERGYISHTHVGDGERPCETFARAAAARSLRALLSGENNV